MEEQLLGSVREGLHGESSLRRLPFVLARFPLEAARLPMRLRKFYREQHQWWAMSTACSPTSGVRLLARAVDKFDAAMRIHIIGYFL